MSSAPKSQPGRRRAPASLWRNPVHWIAFGFGAGAAPFAPGTFGTAAAVPIYLLLQDWPLGFYLFVTAAMFGAGAWLCGRTAAELGVRDHPGIVWDEIVGFLVAMTAAPAGWHWLALGFVLFRLFDILKPWPIRWFESRLGGGLGIMIDDLLAGLYAAAALQLTARLAPV